MLINRYIGLILFIWALIGSSCIERYYNDFQLDFIPSLVVDGTITNESENQEIFLSKSIDVQSTGMNGVSGCTVLVTDKNNNNYFFYETDQGHYQGIISMDNLVVGNFFKISIITPDGSEYESGFEEMTFCPEVDSVYYELTEPMFNESTQQIGDGIQFYVDLKVDDRYSQFYRWNLIETYEYHATWPIKKYWAGQWFEEIPADYSKFVCYKNSLVRELFSVTTQYVKDEYLKAPLVYVDNTTQRLLFKYSLLIKQYSLTQEAYRYWDLLKQNGQENGGMFDKQPANIVGNIKCITNPDEKVLGYFSVSKVTTKRIFVSDVEGLEFPNLFCSPVPIEGRDIYYSSPFEWPIYIAPEPENALPGYYSGSKRCFDCTEAGGSIEPPDFWEE